MHCSLFPCFCFSIPFSILITSLLEERVGLYVPRACAYFARVNCAPFPLLVSVRSWLRFVIVALSVSVRGWLRFVIAALSVSVRGWLRFVIAALSVSVRSWLRFVIVALSVSVRGWLRFVIAALSGLFC